MSRDSRALTGTCGLAEGESGGSSDLRGNSEGIGDDGSGAAGATKEEVGAEDDRELELVASDDEGGSTETLDSVSSPE